MAISIDATAGGADSNSYITLTEFNTYLDTRLHTSSTVTDATDDTKNRAIALATRMLDEQIEWDGDPTESDTQALQWPRSDLYDDKGEELDEDTIPTRISNATAELACYLIDSDRLADSSSDGIRELKAESVEIQFNTNAPPPRNVIPDAVWQIVSIWGTKKFGRKIVHKLERA